MLAPGDYLDLVGLPEADATAALLGALSARNKQPSAPADSTDISKVQIQRLRRDRRSIRPRAVRRDFQQWND
jgi:hypothetical protein